MAGEDTNQSDSGHKVLSLHPKAGASTNQYDSGDDTNQYDSARNIVEALIATSQQSKVADRKHVVDTLITPSLQPTAGDEADFVNHCVIIV